MKRRIAAFLLAVLTALSLSGCGGNREPGEPPDLTGQWAQKSTGVFYHVATITDDMIRIYWVVSEDQSEYLYWSGTFTPPETDEEPYSWTSTNDLRLAEKFVRASREETKTFTYEDGAISYMILYGRFRMGIRLERVEEVPEEAG